MPADVLLAQQLAVADDDAVAVVAAEVRVDRQHRAVAPGDVADGLVDAAAEVVAGEGRAKLAHVAELDVAHEVRHAVLLLLLDGDAQLLRLIAQLARRIFLEGARGFGRDAGVGRGQGLLDDRLLILRVDGERLAQLAVGRGRGAGQRLDGLLVLHRRPLRKARLHVRHVAQRRAGVAQRQQHAGAKQRHQHAVGVRVNRRKIEMASAKPGRVFHARLFLRRSVVAAHRGAREGIQMPCVLPASGHRRAPSPHKKSAYIILPSSCRVKRLKKLSIFFHNLRPRGDAYGARLAHRFTKMN